MLYRQHRYNTQFPLQVRTLTGLQKGQVVDVNNGGARITGLREVRRGDKIHLDILNYRAGAIVQWAAGGQVGVMFRPQINDDQVDILRQRRDSRNAHTRGSVGFGFQEMR